MTLAHETPACSKGKLHICGLFRNGVNVLQGFAVSPDDLPDIIFGSIGRTVWRDIGATAVCFRLVRTRHQNRNQTW